MDIAGERAIGAEATSGSGGTSGTTLGKRIVAAARLAVAVHLFESLAASTQNYGQQFAIGGAGAAAPATADRARARRPFRISGDGRGHDHDGRDASAEAGSR
jgi:hypothetical protein